MEPSAFDEIQFFRAVDRTGVRALLIGRRALVFLGVPVLTADYDFWIAIDDIEAFNARSSRWTMWSCVPTLDDLILTKQVAARPKDLEDIRLLRILKEERS